MSEKLPYDADCLATHAAMERFLRALVIVGGHFTDSFTLHPIDKASRSVSVFFRVWLRPGTERQFEELAKIDPIKQPPRVDLGLTSSLDDDAHTAREQSKEGEK